MKMTTKRSTFTGPGVSDPQGPAEGRSGPGLPPSSSHDGPTSELMASSGANVAIAKAGGGSLIPRLRPAPMCVKVQRGMVISPDPGRQSSQETERKGRSERRNNRGKIPRDSSEEEKRTGRSRSLRRKSINRGGKDRGTSHGRETEEECEDSDALMVSDNDVQLASTSEEGGQGDEGLDNGMIELTRDLLKEAQVDLREKLGKEECPSVLMDKQEDGRGRKAVTGEYYIKRLKEAKAELSAEADILRKLRDGIAPETLSLKRRGIEKELDEKMNDTPTESIPAMIFEAVNTVDMVAQKAGKMPGTFQKKLNHSAATVKVAISHLLQRAEGIGRIEKEMEIERLRQKVNEQERELEGMRRLQQEHEQMRRELQEQHEQIKRLLEREAQNNKRTERGAKRKKVNSPIDSSSEEEYIPRREKEEEELPREEEGNVEVQSNMEEKEGESHHQEEKMAIEEEETEPESSRNEVMEGIERDGMPPVIRPSILGQRRVLDPEVPPAAKRDKQEIPETSPTNTTTETMEKRLATMLVKVVEEKVERMGERLMKMFQESLPRNKGKEENRSGSPPPPAKKEGKGKGMEKKIKEGKREIAPKGKKTEGGNKPTGSSQTATPLVTAYPREKEAQTEDLFSKVIGRKEKAATKKAARQQQQQGGNAGSNGSQQVKRRVPRTAAVTLTCPPGTYAENMGVVRQAINLKDLGITKPPNTRRTATGALNIELSGQGSEEQADALANRMREVLEGREGVRVARPSVMAEIRVTGFDESVTMDEIREAVAGAGKASQEQVTAGPISQGPGKMGMVVVKCPVKAANAVSKEGKITLGWTRAKAVVLEKRPLQCYRCQEMGHTRATCRSEVDRTGACYRCGEQGHVARGCEAPARCVVCESKGQPANHRIGGKACSGGIRRNGKNPKGIGRREDPQPLRKGEMEKGTQEKDGSGKKEKDKPRKKSAVKVISNEKVTDFRLEKGRILVPKGQQVIGSEKPNGEKGEEGKSTGGRVEPTDTAARNADEMEISPEGISTILAGAGQGEPMETST